MISPEEKIINDKISEYDELKKYLLENGQVTYENFVGETFRKYLLISCASLFENLIQEIISEFVSKNTSSEMVKSLVKSKVIERQYHTYFDWKNRSANSFYKLFGGEFADSMKLKIKSDDKLKESEKAFLEIGSERNLLVHENFLGYQLNKTVDEILELFKEACDYIRFLKDVLI